MLTFADGGRGGQFIFSRFTYEITGCKKYNENKII